MTTPTASMTPVPAPDDARTETIVQRVLDRLGLTTSIVALVNNMFRYRTLFGIVSSAGAITNAGSGEWAVSRNGAGDYTVTFDPDFSAVPTVNATVGNGATVASAQLGTGGTTAAQTRILVFDNSGVATDAPVHFSARGAR